MPLRGCIVGVDIVVALTKKLPSEMGVAPCWQCLQLWSKLTCKETQPGKIGLRTETSVEVDFDKLFRGILIMA